MSRINPRQKQKIQHHSHKMNVLIPQYFATTVISVTSRHFSPFFRQPLFVQYLFNNQVSSSSRKCAGISSIPGLWLLPQETASNLKKQIGCFWTHAYNAFFFLIWPKNNMLTTFRQRKTKVRVLRGCPPKNRPLNSDENFDFLQNFSTKQGLYKVIHFFGFYSL